MYHTKWNVIMSKLFLISFAVFCTSAFYAVYPSYLKMIVIHLDSWLYDCQRKKTYCFCHRHYSSYVFVECFWYLLDNVIADAFHLLLCNFAVVCVAISFHILIVAFCGIFYRHCWIVVLLTLNNLSCAFNKQQMPIKNWIIGVQFASTSIQNIPEVLFIFFHFKSHAAEF